MLQSTNTPDTNQEKNMSKPTVPQTLKGFRDFLPAEKRQRDYVAEIILKTFRTFGFEPLETPTLEYAELLMGKYGEEADKLVYNFTDNGGRQVGLRYDQTVPTARVLAQYQNELPAFFRRYQFQNVFRAEKPQKGRYREFTQCDIDIFNTTSPIADAEIIACTYAAYKAIGFKQVEIRINDRQTLMATLQPFATPEVDVFSIIQSIDKLDKKSPNQVQAELVSKGLSENQASSALAETEKAVMSDNLQQIVDNAQNLGVAKNDLKFTPSLARGLDYYTGMIFEVILPEYPVGSCGGGGRYDNLIEELSGSSIPAVGMAFGFDRTVEAALTCGLIPNATANATVLMTYFDKATLAQSMQLVAQLRSAGITTVLYPEPDKLKKQLKLANQARIPYVLMIGSNEAKDGTVTVKNMESGEQKTVAVDEVVEYLG